MKKLSVIIPCFNEEEAVPLFYEAFMKETAGMNVEFELMFVDDGSRDRTLEAFKALHEKDERVHYLSFSRNFGKESAMFAGMEAVTGDYVAIMDVDLQDPPALLRDMLKGIEEEGYDCVASRRVTRKGEPPIRSFFARAFYRLINKISKTEIVDGARDFRLMTRQMVNSILELREVSRFSKGLFGWVGFKTKWIEFENVERVAGETKWSFWKLFKYSIEGIVAFTTTPLVISSAVGFAFCVIALAATVFIFLRKLIFGDPVTGWASTVCIITFLGGIQLFFLGVIGQYLAKAYLEIKNRPLYVVGETNINEGDSHETL